MLALRESGSPHPCCFARSADAARRPEPAPRSLTPQGPAICLPNLNHPQRNKPRPPTLPLQYLRTFQEVFGTNPLVLQEFDWTATPRPFCGSKTLGCVYL